MDKVIDYCFYCICGGLIFILILMLISVIGHAIIRADHNKNLNCELVYTGEYTYQTVLVGKVHILQRFEKSYYKGEGCMQ